MNKNTLETAKNGRQSLKKSNTQCTRRFADSHKSWTVSLILYICRKACDFVNTAI